MAPNPIVDRYKLYKAGTDKLVQWLAETASSCGCLSLVLKPTVNTTDKQAKPERANRTIELKTRDLITLAKGIVTAKPAVPISSTIVELAEDVIAGRQYCADWYASGYVDRDSELQERNDAHSHFIRVVRQVLDIVRPFATAKQQPQPAEKTAKKTKAQASKVVDHLSNFFGYLEIEEPVNEPLGEVPVAMPPKPVATATATHYVLADEKERDIPFRLWCFLTDLHELRTFVKDTWMEWQSGQVSLMAASAVANVAFSLMHRASDEFAKTDPDMVKYEHVLTNFAERLPGPMEGFQAFAFPPESPLLTLLCPDAAFTLYTLERHVVSHMNETFTNSGTPDDLACVIEVPSTNGTHMDDKLTKVLLGAVESITDYAASLMKAEAPLPGDMLLLGLCKFLLDADDRPMWLMAAVQAYQDIFKLVETCSDPFIGATHLRDWNTRQAEIVRDYAQWSSNIWVDCCDDERWEPFFGMAKTLPQLNHWLDIAMSAAEQDQAIPQLSIHVPGGSYRSVFPFELALRLPVMACEITREAQYKLHMYGLGTSNDVLVVLAAAHLYRAARHYGLLSTEWHDMDFVIAQQSSNQAFVAKANAKSHAYAIPRQYRMALGIPLSTLANGQRPKLRDHKDTHASARRVQLVSDFMRELARPKPEDWSPRDCLHSTLEMLLRVPPKKGDNRASNPGRSQQPSQARSVQLLAIYKKAFIAEEPNVYFDYVGFSRTCFELLAKLQIVIRKTTGVKDATELGYTTVDYVLWDTADELTKGKSVSGTLFAVAAALVEGTVAENGKKFTKAAFDESSGRLPKHKWPKVRAKAAGTV